MQNIHSYRGPAAALLCAALFLMNGCSRSQAVYLAGLESEIAEAQSGTEWMSETIEANDGTVLLKESSDVQEDSDDSSGSSQETESEHCVGYVYVCGAVRNPGVYPIFEDMRVFEVLNLAGGFSEEADEQWLNQAESVLDGQRLYVYTKEETAQLRESGVTADAAAFSGIAQEAVRDQKVNINTADRDTLMTLPGIGEAKADAIILYRETNGGFGSVEEIQNISGIKTAVFSQIKDRITV